MAARSIAGWLSLGLWVPISASAGVIFSHPLSHTYSGPAVVNANVHPGTGAPPLVPDNDNEVLASPNRIDITKDILSMAAPIDIEFTVFDSGGTTEYFINEAVANLTFTNWDGYRFQLGYSVLGAFQPSTPFDFLDFDAPFRDPQPSSSQFVDHFVASDELWFSTGVFRSFVAGSFVLSFDIPDHSAHVPDGAQVVDASGAVVGYRFILREIPFIDLPPLGGAVLGGGLVFDVPPFNPRGRPLQPCPVGGVVPPCEDINIPEPGALSLLLIAGATIAARRWRER